MTTESHRQATLAQIAADIRRCSEAHLWATHQSDWRADALERAADYALAGMFQESKRFSQMFIQGDRSE